MRMPFGHRRDDPREAALARLADGSLPDSDRADIAAEVTRDPELAASLAEQQRAVSLLHSLSEPAPAALRERLSKMTVAARPVARRRRAAATFGSLAVAGAALVAVVVLLTSGGTGPAPSVKQAARLAVAPATLPPPAVDVADPTRLRLSMGGIAFPNWRPLRLTTAGARTGTLDGRRVATVYYTTPGGARIGYVIVGGPPIASVRGRIDASSGVRYTVTQRAGAQVVTWVRDGHTCIIGGTGVSAQTLLALAEYQSA